MKKSLLKTTGIITLLLICSGIFFFSQETDFDKEKEEYINYIENHPYALRDIISEDELKKMPKQDRPDQALEHNFLQIVDPKLKRVPSEKLVDAFKYTKSMLSQSTQGIGFKRVNGKSFSLSENLNGDKVETAAIAGVNWVERGPDNVGGRTRALMWDPNDPTTTKVWAGSASGGLWFNNDITDANSSWISVDDFLTSLSISSITYDPTNPSTYYVGTGEGTIAGNGGGGVSGAGLYKSTDSGTTWNLLPSTLGPDFRFIQRVEVTPTGTVLISTRESLNEGGQGGIFRSTDGGDNWTRVVAGRGGDMDLASNGDIYASEGIGFGSGNGSILRSVDDGITWTDVTPPGGNPLRIELAVAPSASSTTENTVVYAVAQDASNGTTITWFQRSDDGGENWTNLTIPEYREQNCTTNGRDFTRGQAFYDLILAVQPDDEDIITLGGINVLRSSDAGVNTNEVSYWTGGCDAFVHADQHEAVFRPGFPAEAIFGHDGGVSYSPNVGTSSNPTFFTRNRNYSVTQFYAVAAENSAGSGNFLAGAQDNGTQRFTAANGSSTTEATGGDGGFTHIDQTDGSFQTTSFTGNTVNHSSDGGISFSGIANSAAGLFINPTDLDNDAHILYSAGDNDQLLRIQNINTASPDAQEVITIDVGQISHVQANAFADNRIFVGTRQGDIFRIDDANAANPIVTDITSNITSFGNVSSVDIGSNDDQLIATYSNFGVTSVWLSIDGGSTWVSKDDNNHGLPDIPIRWSLFNPNNTAQVLLATELGVWSTDNILADNPEWEPTVTNLANVRCDMIQYREADDVLVLATFGRGVYTSDAFSNVMDSAPPVLISLTPADEETEVLLTVNLEASFNETIQTGTGNIEIRRSADNSVFETIDVTTATTSSSTLILNPSSELEPLTEYYVSIPAGAITDNSGNVFGGIVDNTTWSFTTFDGDFPPTVATEIEDVRSVRDFTNIVNLDVDLSGVFTDVDNDDTAITKQVTANTNTALLSTAVAGDVLTLSINPGLIGNTLITVEGNSNGKTITDQFEVVVGDEILINQFDTPTGGAIISMEFTDEPGNIVQTADDFTVTDGELWELTGITVNGFSNGQTINAFRVEIYGDLNNAPDENNLIYQEEVDVNYLPNQGIIRLPINSLELESGDYWVSVLSISPISTARWNWVRSAPNTDSEFRLIDRLGFFDGVTPGIWLSGTDVGIGGEDCQFNIEGLITRGPDAPSDLSLEQLSGTEIEVQWTDNADNETGFLIERSSTSATEGFEEIITTAADVSSFTDDDDFDTNASYFYRISAIGTTINSAFTDVEQLLTLPAAPTLLAATDVDTEGFTINWEATDGVRQFEVDISSDNFATFVNGFEAVPVTINTSLEIGGIDANSYQYRVRSRNSSGLSPNSEVGTSVIITGLQNSLEDTFQFGLFPNPANENITLQIPGNVIGEMTLKIYDWRGITVMDTNVNISGGAEIPLNVSELSLGMYVIVLQNQQEFSRAQFIKVN